jgi:hypothetical protein
LPLRLTTLLLISLFLSDLRELTTFIKLSFF